MSGSSAPSLLSIIMIKLDSLKDKVEGEALINTDKPVFHSAESETEKKSVPCQRSKSCEKNVTALSLLPPAV